MDSQFGIDCSEQLFACVDTFAAEDHQFWGKEVDQVPKGSPKQRPCACQ